MLQFEDAEFKCLWNLCLSESCHFQSLSHVWLFVILWTAPCQASLSFTISQSLLKFMSIESVMASNHPILCHYLFFLPSIFSSIRGFSSESAVWIRWPRYWSFSFIINPSNKYSGLISIKIDWFDLVVYRHANKLCPLKRQLFPYPKGSQFCMDLQFISVFLIHKYLYYFTFSLTGHIFCLNPSLIMR